MSARTKQRIGYFCRLWDWFKNGLVQVVPEDIAFCAFDCHEPQCRHSEWKACKKRLRGWAVYVMPTTREKTNG